MTGADFSLAFVGSQAEVAEEASRIGHDIAENGRAARAVAEFVRSMIDLTSVADVEATRARTLANQPLTPEARSRALGRFIRSLGRALGRGDDVRHLVVGPGDVGLLANGLGIVAGTIDLLGDTLQHEVDKLPEHARG